MGGRFCYYDMQLGCLRTGTYTDEEGCGASATGPEEETMHGAWMEAKKLHERVNGVSAEANGAFASPDPAADAAPAAANPVPPGRPYIPRSVRERYPELSDPVIAKLVLDGEAPAPREKGETAATGAKLVTGDRNAAYGHPYTEAKRISAIYNAIRGHVNGGWKLTPLEFEYIMVAMKLSRQQNSHKRDNFDDCCGYLDIACVVTEHTAAEIREAVRAAGRLDEAENGNP